ncbi:hypothetical protein MJO29_015086 [Puccinia striiformis f. sp. tritici]|nr:hypothetical protein MJO29_015086 [Puccinia striiformis f. sp. tritici]
MRWCECEVTVHSHPRNAIPFVVLSAGLNLVEGLERRPSGRSTKPQRGRSTGNRQESLLMVN